MIQAKPVIPDKFWILRQDDRKIGNIESDGNGFSVCINNKIQRFKTLNMVKQRVKIDFQSSPTNYAQHKDQHQVHGYPTDRIAHNPMFDVQQQLPLYTQQLRSKSWYAAGWYCVRQHRIWQVMFCPKLIVLQRYQFRGPYHTQVQAEQS